MIAAKKRKIYKKCIKKLFLFVVYVLFCGFFTPLILKNNTEKMPKKRAEKGSQSGKSPYFSAFTDKESVCGNYFLTRKTCVK